MSRIVRHRFRDTTEANAFVAGVEWVNDSAIQVIDIEVGDYAIVVCEDDDGGEDSPDILVDYLDNGDATYSKEVLS